ncbi:MAG: cobalt-precorrin-5B (C(1))-methyltransferase CbiD [Lachnospiraceae bacterium]|nr:cobalt-precorrin-5B (C(1))-methyltransferase CbiD [Lachnospiraceae bacterium]
MALDVYVQSAGRKLRCGFTTGTCATLACLGAARALLYKNDEKIPLSVMTPKGIRVEVIPKELLYNEEEQTGICSVVKDGGDDRDVTDGIEIFAKVKYTKEHDHIEIRSAEGIGTVTRAGLSVELGEPAINPVPRQMMETAVDEIRREAGYTGGLICTLSVPGGEKAAGSTFNERLGIKGGISIIGTTGIVEPMSEKAFCDAVCLEIGQLSKEGNRDLILYPGNYGMDFTQSLDLNDIPSVMCSNFIGDAIDAAIIDGYENVLLIGHAGKLVKLAGGIMNTHSRIADCRMELIAVHAAMHGADRDEVSSIMEQLTTDAAFEVIKTRDEKDNTGIYDETVRSLLESIQYHINERIRKDRAGKEIKIGAVLFADQNRLIGVTKTGQEILNVFGKDLRP